MRGLTLVAALLVGPASVAAQERSPGDSSTVSGSIPSRTWVRIETVSVPGWRIAQLGRFTETGCLVFLAPLADSDTFDTYLLDSIARIDVPAEASGRDTDPDADARWRAFPREALEAEEQANGCRARARRAPRQPVRQGAT